jgi:lipopolysaccharide/colanic/teichoic acid biosynthesis glycosyltransferase
MIIGSGSIIRTVADNLSSSVHTRVSAAVFIVQPLLILIETSVPGFYSQSQFTQLQFTIKHMYKLTYMHIQSQ